MVSKRVRPSLYTYNLLLKCTRECGLGDEFETRKTIGKIIDDPHLLTSETKFEGLSALENNELNTTLTPNNYDTEHIENRPNLLDVKPYFGNILGISDIKSSEERYNLSFIHQ